MDTPTRYADICEKALDIGKQYNLTKTQIYLYNHICRGDFYLRNGDGQEFYDPDHNGFGWGSDRKWVEKQFKPLIKAGLVKLQKGIHDCNDPRYTSWEFYDSSFERSDLIDAACYVSAWKLAMIKYYLSLPDGFNKNEVFGDLAFSKKKYESFTNDDDNRIEYDYTISYKGILAQKGWVGFGFENYIHSLWDILEKQGFKQLSHIPNYTEERIV